MRLAIVVGTGRCGSTMLSAILREHPDVLSLTTLAGFLAVDAPRPWLAAAAEIIDPARSGAAAHLDPPALAALQAACAPGERALAAACPAT